jgi:hypothetical protein
LRIYIHCGIGFQRLARDGVAKRSRPPACGAPCGLRQERSTRRRCVEKLLHGRCGARRFGSKPHGVNARRHGRRLGKPDRTSGFLSVPIRSPGSSFPGCPLHLIHRPAAKPTVPAANGGALFNATENSKQKDCIAHKAGVCDARPSGCG